MTQSLERKPLHHRHKTGNREVYAVLKARMPQDELFCSRFLTINGVIEKIIGGSNPLNSASQVLLQMLHISKNLTYLNNKTTPTDPDTNSAPLPPRCFAQHVT